MALSTLSRFVSIALIVSTPGAATAATTEDAPQLHIATLNTWGLPYPVAWVDRRERFPEISRFLESLDADLVGLQEVWWGARGLLDLDGLWMGTERRGDSGLAVLSPHPTTIVAERGFDRARGADRLKRKGVLHVRVDHADVGELDVLVTHLQAGGGAVNAAVRAAQVDEILQMLGGVEGAAVVLGDFNFHPEQPHDHAAAQSLVDAGLRDAATVAGDRRATHVRDSRRYDRVYLRDGADMALRTEGAEVLTYGDDALSLLSDHRPVTVQVRAVPR